MDPRWTELGSFLRSRRARAEPRFALPDDRRRVPGQRRDEVASAAGVSVAYYIRLEQGRAPNVSDSVLAAVCRALELDEAERAHVWRLARPVPTTTATGSTEFVRPHVLTLLETLEPTPALVLGRDRHILAWNGPAHELHAGHLDRTVVDDVEGRPWWPQLLFCDQRVADRFVDWPAKARDTVSDLRVEVGRRPYDDRLLSLVADLRRKSAAFDGLWTQYPILPCSFHERVYRHPHVGELTLRDEYLELADDGGQRLALFHAAPGSPSATALANLAGSGSFSTA